mmetsp:Transcript_53972/g.101338  ORF Transcript_53972/g.101338 Transcript_53972/m.101338 type:complete len:784 (-) Transcript_53972:280-2631(-)
MDKMYITRPISLFEHMHSPGMRCDSPAASLPAASMSPATAMRETPDMMRSESPVEASSGSILAAFGGDSTALEAESPVRTLCPQPRRLLGLPLLEGGGGLNSPILPPTSPDPVTPSNFELENILKPRRHASPGFEKTEGCHLPFDGSRYADSRPLSALSALSTQCPDGYPKLDRSIDSRPLSALSALSTQCLSTCANSSAGPTPSPDEMGRNQSYSQGASLLQLSMREAFHAASPSPGPWPVEDSWSTGSRQRWPELEAPMPCRVGEVPATACERIAAAQWSASRCSPPIAAVGEPWDMPMMVHPAAQYRSAASVLDGGLPSVSVAAAAAAAAAAGNTGVWGQPVAEQATRVTPQPPGLAPPPAPCTWPPGLHREVVDPGFAVSTSTTASLAEVPKDEACLLDVISEGGATLESRGQGKQRRSRRGGARNKATESKPVDLQQSKQPAQRQAIAGSSSERCLELPDDHRLVQLSQTQAGSKFLQRKLLKGHPSVIKDILDGIEMELPTLMCDAYGNYLCSAAFQACSVPQRHRMLEIAMSSLREVAKDRWGTHSLQALISLLCTIEEQSFLMNSLREHVVELSCDVHGVHVVQRALMSFGSSFLDTILPEVLRNFHILAHNPHSLGILKKCISQSRSGMSQQVLLETLSKHAVEFAQSTFGNYAVQHAFEEWGGEICEPIVQALAGKLVQLSIQKFSSNVVEQMLISAMPSTRRVLMEELSNVDQMAILMSTVYGHYVARRALQTADSDQKVTLENAIALSFQNLRNRRLKARWERVLRGETDP